MAPDDYSHCARSGVLVDWDKDVRYLEDREGGPGGESAQETVWKSGSSREGGTAFLSVHFKSDDYDIMYNTLY